MITYGIAIAVLGSIWMWQQTRGTPKRIPVRVERNPRRRR